jgi:hypothetical protein
MIDERKLEAVVRFKKGQENDLRKMRLNLVAFGIHIPKISLESLTMSTNNRDQFLNQTI